MTGTRPHSSNRSDTAEGGRASPFPPPTIARPRPDDSSGQGIDSVLRSDAPLTSANFASVQPAASQYPAIPSSNYLSVSNSSPRPRANTASTFPSPPLVGPEILGRPTTRAGPNVPATPNNMFQTGQRDPTRPYVPPPPPPMSPPMAQQLGGGMVIPPPPPLPRFPSAPAGPAPNMLGTLPPPPSVPPPSALGQQAPWHSTWGRMYDGRTGLIPPPPSGQHQAYNPKFQAQVAVGQTLQIPPPPPPSEQMSATYIPQGDTYGEGVGIPGLGGIADEAAAYSATSTSSWGQTPTTSQASDATQMTTPQDENGRGLYAGTPNSRGPSNASNAAASVPSELSSQWPLDRVLLWLQGNQFSKDWQETFKGLGLHGAQFLELGIGHGGRGNFGMMHQQVYPRLAQECTASGTGWDQSHEREEGRRMRQLVRSIVKGGRGGLDIAKATSGHGRKESISGSNVLPSAGTDPGDSPAVSWQANAESLDFDTDVACLDRHPLKPQVLDFPGGACLSPVRIRCQR
jgi:mitogen-activated protein kinase kinase kinase